MLKLKSTGTIFFSLLPLSKIKNYGQWAHYSFPIRKCWNYCICIVSCKPEYASILWNRFYQIYRLESINRKLFKQLMGIGNHVFCDSWEMLSLKVRMGFLSISIYISFYKFLHFSINCALYAERVHFIVPGS